MIGRRRAQTFTEFVRSSLRVTLTPAQDVLYRVACDGVQPRDLKLADERAIAHQLFGDVDEVPPLARDTLVMVKGARVGGSRFAAVRLVHLALTLPLGDALAPGEEAAAIIVGPDLRLARQAERFALGAAESIPALSKRVAVKSEDRFTIVRDDGRRVRIECLPATRGGSALRGRSLVGALLTESSFFRDENFVVCDAELYRAVAPRVLPGGQLLVESTPWTEVGLTYELFTSNHGHPTTALAAHCPTLLMRPDPKIGALVAAETERDPENAAREFGAMFLSGGAGLFFSPDAIARCVDPALVMPAPIPRGAFVAPEPPRMTQEHAIARAMAKDLKAFVDAFPKPGPARREQVVVAMGVDLGFVHDSSAAVVVARARDRFRVLDIVELRPSRNAPLVPSQVVAEFAAVARHFGLRSMTGDQVYRESVREQLRAHGLGLRDAPTSSDAKLESYLLVKRLLHEGRIELPNHPRLLNQLKSVVLRRESGGVSKLASPRTPGGGHGDVVSALVLACLRASQMSSQSDGWEYEQMKRHATAGVPATSSSQLGPYLSPFGTGGLGNDGF